MHSVVYDIYIYVYIYIGTLSDLGEAMLTAVPSLVLDTIKNKKRYFKYHDVDPYNVIKLNILNI